MEMRFKESRRSTVTSLQKQMLITENRKPGRPEPIHAEPVPDLTELMNDWFFGTPNNNHKVDKPQNNNNDREIKPQNIIAGDGVLVDEEEDGSRYSPRNNNSRLTQEWLQEAKRVVAASPGRCDSPSRLVGSPRFASGGARDFDRRDPLSRSARRHRSVESFSDEILSKSAKHSRNKSETVFESQPQLDAAVEVSPASAVHQWFSNILKPHHHVPQDSNDPKPHNNSTNTTTTPQDSSEEEEQTIKKARPPRQPIRKSRFRDVPTATTTTTTTASQPIVNPLSRRNFRPPRPTGAPDEKQLLSPPKNVIESTHRRSISVATCSLSPPGDPDLEPAQRRKSVSSSFDRHKISTTKQLDPIERTKENNVDGVRDLNAFLKEQRLKLARISSGEIKAKAKIILSGSSNSTSSMVAAICYAWLLDSRIRETEKEGNGALVVPVMNMRRGRMWKQRQVAWLLHHVGIDATSLFFSDEVDLENLMMVGQLSMMVVGQEILKTNNEVGSPCTLLTDNYCEDAYDLLQIPVVKTLMLAGILLDTNNLSSSTKFSMNRDSEAVQLLIVGSAPNYRNTFFEQLMQDQCDATFLENLQYNYGKAPKENGNVALVEPMVSVRKSTSTAYQGLVVPTSDKNSNDPKPAQKSGTPQSAPPRAPEPAPREKNKFSIARWFGFGSKG